MHQVMAQDGFESWRLVHIKNLIEPFIRAIRTCTMCQVHSYYEFIKFATSVYIVCE